MASLLWTWMVVCAWAGMPVESVNYTVDVVGPLADVTIQQVFYNDSDRTIEAVYVFPMHEEAAVDGMVMRIGDRVVQGVVQEKSTAIEEYEEALDEGFTAALITQQRPNIFTQRVGNIGPGERVEVVLRAIQPVPHLDGSYRLVLPLVVMPRFVRGHELSEALDELSKPAHARAFPGAPMTRSDTGLRAGLDIVVDAGLPFTDIHSTTHDVHLAIIGDRARGITAEVPMDRDFALRWSVSTERPTAAAWVQSDHAILTLEPPESPPREHIVPRELIWVIDKSCSMSGQPIEMARQAMLEALRHVDGRDSLRILRFSNTVVGDKRSRAASSTVLAGARMQIRGMSASGGAYLLEGVSVALDTRPDPTRERYVMFLTDGGIGNDREVLATIADKVGNARLFAFGVGPASNRWLLDEMSRFGGGKTTWIRHGEDPKEAVQRFVDTIDKPVLTDIEIDWGDWQAQDVWPKRFPALYAGQPLMISARIVEEGTTPIVVRGRLGDGVYEQIIDPTLLEEGRALPSTWARQKIANLERDQVWGDVPELADDILETSLDYQVMSQYVAFIAVDRTRRVSPGGPEAVEEQPADKPAGAFEELVEFAQGTAGISAEAHVIATRDMVNVESTSTSEVITKNFLERLPTGRSYQSAVGMAAGVTGQGGNKNISGGSTRENTYMLDGANITDPVTGAFSVNFNYDAIEQIEVMLDGFMPEYTSAGTIVNIVSENGTNNLEWESGAHHLQGRDLAHNTAAAQVSGPIVRDKLWQLSSIEAHRAVLGDREWLGATGMTKITHQPMAEHRFTLTGQLDPWTVDSDLLQVSHMGGLGQGRWQWFLSPDTHLDVLVSGYHANSSGDARSRLQGHARFTMVSVRDPLGGEHDAKLGIEGEALHWTTAGPISEALLGAGRPPSPAADRFGAFIQDSWKPRPNLVVNYGSRLDLAFGRAHLGPRAFLAWDPWGDQRTKLATGYGQYWGNIDLVVAAAPPAGTLVRHDEVIANVEREIIEDFALKLHTTFDRWFDVPTVDGGRTAQRELRLQPSLHRVKANRWEAQATWTWTRPLLRERDTLYNDGATRGYAHSGRVWAFWDLPTDPWTQSIGLTGDVHMDPLGTATPIGNPDKARLGGGARLQQTIDVRIGELVVDASLSHWAELADRRPLNEVLQVDEPLPDLPGSGGLRWRVGLEYAF